MDMDKLGDIFMYIVGTIGFLALSSFGLLLVSLLWKTIYKVWTEE